MTGIDPTTCTPGPYRVIFEGVDRDAFRLSHKSRPDWVIQKDHDLHLQTGHSAITVLHRLVPEAEATADEKWVTLRKAADIYLRPPLGFGDDRARAMELNALADRLEAEHRAAQEKAAQDARRREIAAEAIDAYKAAVRAECGENSVDAIPFESGILAVVDTVRAAVLAEPGEES
ncbi:hypothetical protein [Gordonia malaquae]|uniref:hypothetical protein n=1 Tax=Gordonia malaquae TaxID=410332 RepID=UPI003016F7BA